MTARRCPVAFFSDRSTGSIPPNTLRGLTVIQTGRLPLTGGKKNRLLFYSPNNELKISIALTTFFDALRAHCHPYREIVPVYRPSAIFEFMEK
jgi:hypothetical protein